MGMSRRLFTGSLAAAGVAGMGAGLGAGLGACAGSVVLPSSPAAESTTPSLDALARLKGLRFGNAMGMGSAGQRGGLRFQDPAYRDLMARECSVIVAENETKWPQLRPDPRQPYDFGPADEMFRWAKGQGMALRGHTLVWMESKWLPAWLASHDFGSNPTVGMERVLSEHVAATCGHFGRDIESWDVVNEAVVPDTGALRSNLFTQRLGGVEHIARMFELAREHAPHAQLVYNDYMSWDANNAAHRAGVLRLLAALKARGAPVQALGLQAHVGVWEAPQLGAHGGEVAAKASEWRRFLDEVMGMGLDLLITEFDVNDRALPSDVARRDAGVAAATRDWLDVTLASRRLQRMLTWGLADHHSWLQDFAPRADGLPKRPLPYDAQLRPKPLRAAIADALRAMPARPAA